METSLDDPLAFVQGLFVQHLPALRGFVTSLVSDFSLVDDIVQETFITVTRKAADFAPGSNFKAWLWTIARFKTLEALRASSRQRVLSLLLPISVIAEEITTAVQEAVYASAESQTHSPAKRLPAKK